MDFQYVIYIDEAGDEGFGKIQTQEQDGQSSWFAVGGLIVKRQNDRSLVTWRDEIRKQKSKSQSLHFKNMDHEHSVFACKHIASKPLRFGVTFSNKITLQDLSKDRQKIFKQKSHLYNYTTRYLIERISRYIKMRSQRDQMPKCRAKIIFSRRGGMKYEDFQSYLHLIKDGREKIFSPGRIDWDVIDPDLVEALAHEKRAGLQIADICTSAFWKAVNPNRWGMTEPRYANELRQVVFKDKDGRQYNAGLTSIPPLRTPQPLSQEQEHFLRSWI